MSVLGRLTRSPSQRAWGPPTPVTDTVLETSFSAKIHGQKNRPPRPCPAAGDSAAILWNELASASPSAASGHSTLGDLSGAKSLSTTTEPRIPLGGAAEGSLFVDGAASRDRSASFELTIKRSILRRSKPARSAARRFTPTGFKPLLLLQSIGWAAFPFTLQTDAVPRSAWRRSV
jgi:hypothetical protein